MSCEELTHWKRLWCWEELGAGGEGDDRGWDGWMASLTRWTWVSVNSGSWWWTGSPGVLWFMGSQRVGHDWATDLIWSMSFVKGRKNFGSTQTKNKRSFNRHSQSGCFILHRHWQKYTTEKLAQNNNISQLIGLIIRNQRKKMLGYSLLWHRSEENIMEQLL